MIFFYFLSVEKLNMTMENISWGKALWGAVGVSYKSDSAPSPKPAEKQWKKSDDKGAVNHCTQLFELIGINLLL